MRAAWAILAFCTSFSGGCMTGDGMQSKLRDATTEYNRSLRWRDVDRAAEFLPADAQQRFLARQEDVEEELIVLDYELTRLDLDKQTGVAASRATIWWHTEDSTIVEDTTVDQLWQWNDGKFVLVDERRASGTPLVLFAEVDEGEHPYLPGLHAYRKQHEIGEANKKGRRPGRKAPKPEPTEPWANRSADRNTAARRPGTFVADGEHGPAVE
jgi:hypothetical protein